MYGKINKFALLFLLFFCTPTLAVSLSGEGYGKSHDLAKSNALASLSESILVDIKSSFDSAQDNLGNKEALRQVHLRSDLPMLGANVTVVPKKEGFYATAVLNSERSIPLYQSKLSDLNAQLKQLATTHLHSKDNSDSRYTGLNTMLTSLDMYKKYQTVARFLGVKNIDPPVTETELKEQLLTFRESISTLSLGGKYLAENVNVKSVYVYPARSANSREITPFSRLLRDYLGKHLKTVEAPLDADYLYKGVYEDQEKFISVTYRLMNKSGDTFLTNVIKLAPEAYKSISYKPTQVNFEQLLHQGIVVSNDFRVNINTNLGREDLLFQRGQEVEIFVKLNRSGYFYIVGHTLNQDGKTSSYLLELSGSQGKRRFITYVNADDVNKWLSLGAFEVSAPYGIESIQIIAANRDLLHQLPNYHFSEKLGIHVLSNNPAESLLVARALRPVYRKKDKLRSAEAVLMFTTMDRVDQGVEW